MKHHIQRSLLLLGMLACLSLIEASTKSRVASNNFTSSVESFNIRWTNRQLSDASEHVCEPYGECEACTAGQGEKEAVCAVTGLVQRFRCKAIADQSGSPGDELRSCKRTVEDEEFLMLRMQVMCFLFGSLTLVAVRKQRGTAGTLFDQRKFKRGSESYNAEGEIEMEFSPMVGQSSDERQPLVPIDVV